MGGRGTVFPYLDDTVGDSVTKVIARRPVLSLLVGLVLAVLVWFLVRRVVPYARGVGRWLLPGRGARGAWFAGTSGAAGLLFALGFDWMRWITSIAFAALLAAGAITVLLGTEPEPGADRPPRGREWHRPVPSRVILSVPAIAALVVAVYLIVLPPLPTAVRGVGDLAHLMLDAPR